MKVAFYMNCVSTHQLPLAREVGALVGVENFVYVYEGESGQTYQRVADVGEIKVEKVGGGGERKVLFTKLTGVTPAEVRKAMREHDTFVFASNGFEGWGAGGRLPACSIGGGLPQRPRRGWLN